MNNARYLTLLLAPISIAALGCGEEADHEHTHEPAPVSIQFAAVVGTEALACDRTYSGIGSSNATASVRDLRFYIHDLRLVSDEGEEVAVTLDQNEYQNGAVALLDFENGSGTCVDGDAPLHTAVTGMAPDDDYTGFKFRLGVPFEQNHARVDASPAPLDKSSLYWSWASGHIFLAAGTTVVIPPTGGSTVTVTNHHFTHVGSTGCQGDPAQGTPVASCARPNRPEYVFTDFDPATKKVVIDLKAIKAGVDVTSGAGCHSFMQAPCDVMFGNLGIDWPTGAEKASQTAMHVE